MQVVVAGLAGEKGNCVAMGIATEVPTTASGSGVPEPEGVEARLAALQPYPASGT